MSPRADERPRPGRVLLTEQELRGRVAGLGTTIARDYEALNPILVGVLQGAFLFMADLIRAMPIDLTTDFIGLSSYGADTTSSGAVRLVSDLSLPIEGRDVLIVDDIVETGHTLTYVERRLRARGPKSLRVCVLLDKIDRREADVDLDYVGFTIPNLYVVGYGFDHAGRYRNLPYVAALDSP